MSIILKIRKINTVRMIVVGECKRKCIPPKEQTPKIPLEQISQVNGLQQDATLERAFKNATKGEDSKNKWS